MKLSRLQNDQAPVLLTQIIRYALLDRGESRKNSLSCQRSKDGQLSTKLASCLEGFKIDVVYLRIRYRVILPEITQTRARQLRFWCDRHCRCLQE